MVAYHLILTGAGEPDRYNNGSRKSFRPEDSMSPLWSKTPFPPPICKSQGHLVRHICILGSGCEVLSELDSRGTVFLPNADARDEWIETDLWVITGSNNVYTLHTSKGVTKHLILLNALCTCVWISFHLAQLSHRFPQNLCICVTKKGSCCLPWFLCHYLKRGWVWLQVWNRTVEECTLEWMQLLSTGLEPILTYLVVLEKKFSIYCALCF